MALCRQAFIYIFNRSFYLVDLIHHHLLQEVSLLVLQMSPLTANPTANPMANSKEVQVRVLGLWLRLVLGLVLEWVLGRVIQQLACLLRNLAVDPTSFAVPLLFLAVFDCGWSLLKVLLSFYRAPQLLEKIALLSQ